MLAFYTLTQALYLTLNINMDWCGPWVYVAQEGKRNQLVCRCGIVRHVVKTCAWKCALWLTLDRLSSGVYVRVCVLWCWQHQFMDSDIDASGWQAPVTAAAACAIIPTGRVWSADATASVTTASVWMKTLEKCVEVWRQQNGCFYFDLSVVTHLYEICCII